ncbi:MAG: DUF2071 domain-containing protein [Actinomycetota bacterium]|nr:DUF2071 domain-containing protein [Actinomycetota bacterium]
MFENVTSLHVDIQNFALVTHAVPAERVRSLVPDRFELQTFVGDGGREMALVSANGFCNRQIRWGASRYPAHDFDQITFRTYVLYRGRASSYFFGTYVSTRLSWIGQVSVARWTWLADFDVDIERGTAGYPSYFCRADGGPGEVSYRLEATDRPVAKTPFETGDELAQFITYRLHGLTRHPLGFQVHGPIEHRRMRPWSGRLLEGRFDFWAALGILREDEFTDVYSVLIEPSVRFKLFLPRLAR